MSVTVEIKGIDQLQRNIDDAKGMAKLRTRKVVKRTALAIESDAKQNAPVGADGRLRASIGVFDISLLGNAVKVGSPLSYAAAVEFGSQPHWPNMDSLKRWARLKLKDESAAWPIAKKISEEGTEPHPYLQPAADKNRMKYIKEMRKIFK